MAFFIVLALILAIAALAPILGADSRNLTSTDYYPQWPGMPESPPSTQSGPLALGLALDSSARAVPAPRSPSKRRAELLS